MSILVEREMEIAADSDENDETSAAVGYAVLFPWFIEAIGVLVFFVLTRRFHGLPYTAVLFLVGTIMGIGATESGLTDQLSQSILMWSGINGELLLLAFLPGLLFRDAFLVNFHLFTKSSAQLFLLAFVMVLAGTALTAVAAKYVLAHYEWSWNFSLTFGAILSATDPVSVAALLNEAGAPPRLKIHIAGESMLNDGSAMVFYTIFSAMYLYDLGLPGGEQVGWGRGVAIFFRMACGGMAIGIAFAFGLLWMLDILKRRLDKEENVIQVAATVSVAYLAFYTAEMCCEMSGILAVIFCGITTRAFGAGLINNPEMMESFWILVEHLLDTILFALGGVVWGTVVTRRGPRQGLWTGIDWGYLILLYVLAMVIRGLLIIAFYPILSRIGLKTNPQESIFLWWAGLRGAVGIALAILLDESVWSNTEDNNPEDYKAREDVTQLFGMVGGVAFLTLVINGVCSGPLLRKLGLTHSTEVRRRIVRCFERRLRKHVIDIFVDRMAHPLYCHIDFALVRHHVPFLADLTIEELKSAVDRRKGEINPQDYRAPHLEYVLPYLINPEDMQSDETAFSTLFTDEEAVVVDPENNELVSEAPVKPFSEHATGGEYSAVERGLMASESLTTRTQEAMELRLIFVELLRAAYAEFTDSGAIDARQYEGILAFSLTHSLDCAADEASSGGPLNDWEHLQIEINPWVHEGKRRVRTGSGRFRKRLCCRHNGRLIDLLSLEKAQASLEISRGIAFIFAHREAQENFQSYFTERDVPFSSAESLVLEESAGEINKAEALLNSFSGKMVRSVLAHVLCDELLNGGARYIEKLLEGGLLKEREGHAYLENIDERIHNVSTCNLDKHPGELSEEDCKTLLTRMKRSLAECKEGEETGVHEKKQPWSRENPIRRHSAIPGKFL